MIAISISAVVVELFSKERYEIQKLLDEFHYTLSDFIKTILYQRLFLEKDVIKGFHLISFFLSRFAFSAFLFAPFFFLFTRNVNPFLSFFLHFSFNLLFFFFSKKIKKITHFYSVKEITIGQLLFVIKIERQPLEINHFKDISLLNFQSKESVAY